MPERVAFVPIRYGPQIVGGSEALTREIALGLAGRGWDVEVLTTRVVNHYSMADELPEGESKEDGLTVRRFSTSHHWSRRAHQAQLSIQDGVVPPIDDQWSWVSWRFTLPDLFHFLVRYGSDYSSVVFSPYLFWNTVACLPAVSGNAVLMPCLHDETYARLDVVRPALSGPKSVWFLSEPEHQLAHTLGPVADHHTLTGAGVNVPAAYDPEGFRRRHGLDRPFVVYAGRREADKGWGWLLRVFEEAIRNGAGEVDLVTFGTGEVSVPPGLRGRVRDLGFLSDADRNDAFAAATAYVQPSRMESFSRTVMEAWLAGTPVLVVEGSAVVAWHCERSGGGFTFRDGVGLAEHLRRLLTDPDLAVATAAKGRQYVVQEYAWPVVLDRMEADLQSLADARTSR